MILLFCRDSGGQGGHGCKSSHPEHLVMVWIQSFPCQIDFPTNPHWGLCLSSERKDYSGWMDFHPGPYHKPYGARDKSVQRGVKRSITLTSPPTKRLDVEGRGKQSQIQNVQKQCFLHVFLM